MEIFILFFFIISDRKILDRFIRSYYDIDKGKEWKRKTVQVKKIWKSMKGPVGPFIKKKKIKEKQYPNCSKYDVHDFV